MDRLGLKVSEGRLLNSDDKTNVVFGFGVNDNLYNPKASYRYGRRSNRPKVDLLSDRITLSLDMSYGDDYIRSGDTVQQKPKTLLILIS